MENPLMNDSQRQTVGPWTLGERLGRGGNASVWKATRLDTETGVALKIISVRKVEQESYQRFVREIRFLREHQAVPGLLPLLDSSPARPAEQGRPAMAGDADRHAHRPGTRR